MQLQTLLDYSNQTRDLLHQVLEANPGAFDRQFETLSEFGSIRQLLAHIIGAEERWLARLRDEPVPARYEEIDSITLSAIWDHWDQVRERTMRFVNKAGPAELTRKLHVSLPKWNAEMEVTVEQVLFHVLNHETHHRAQISMLLQHFGIDPPNFDFVLVYESLRNGLG